MTKNTIPVESFLEAAQVFHWATNRHFQLWFTGQFRARHKRTETVLKRLSLRRLLRSVRYGRGLIYALPRKTRGFVDITPKVIHGLACTEGLVRCYRSRMDGVVIAEKYFNGLGSIPEWGIIYPEGKLLLFEYSSKSNFFFSGLMKAKLQAYKRSLPVIEQKFNAKAIVLFVLDIPSDTVERYAGSLAGARLEGGSPLTPFYFVDYESFLKVPMGQQLTAPIHFWSDGKKYPLSKYD